jgi:hypothetical protein
MEINSLLDVGACARPTLPDQALFAALTEPLTMSASV